MDIKIVNVLMLTIEKVYGISYAYENPHADSLNIFLKLKDDAHI